MMQLDFSLNCASGMTDNVSFQYSYISIIEIKISLANLILCTVYVTNVC
jgi:hypothetical protein